MSEEDIELRDLITQTLQSNGCLAKLKAQLRSSIFFSLNEDNKISSLQPLLNKRIKQFLNTAEGKTMFCIVREFLEFFNLDYTASVFEPESYMDQEYRYEGRQKLAQELGLEKATDTSVPLLLEILRLSQIKRKHIEVDVSSENLDDISPDGNKSDEQCQQKDRDIINSKPVERNLNATFDVNSPTVTFNGEKNEISDEMTDNKNKLRSQNSPVDNSYSQSENTCEDTCSIVEENNSISAAEDSTELKEPKSGDRPKLPPQKCEKVKPTHTSFSSLPDISPSQHNKSRVTDLLPSLYSKEFKDKSNLRELDKMFDMEADYEEDFICSGDDLSLKSDYLKSDHSSVMNPLTDLQSTTKTSESPPLVLNKSELNQNSISKITSNSKLPLFIKDKIVEGKDQTIEDVNRAASQK